MTSHPRLALATAALFAADTKTEKKAEKKAPAPAVKPAPANSATNVQWSTSADNSPATTTSTASGLARAKKIATLPVSLLPLPSAYAPACHTARNTLRRVIIGKNNEMAVMRIRLITTVDVFGFHMATVDLRQNSDVHERVVADLLRHAELPRLEALSLGELPAAGVPFANLRRLSLGYEITSTLDSQYVAQIVKINADQGRLGGLLKLWLTDDAKLTACGTPLTPGMVRALLKRIEANQDEMLRLVQALKF